MLVVDLFTDKLMVTLHKPEMTITNGIASPVMRTHNLKVLKEVPDKYVIGSVVACFISKYQGGRYAVWDSSWTTDTKNYHVFNSEAELHEHFQEL